MSLLILLLVVLVLTILYVAGAIYVAHELQKARECLDIATRAMETFTVRIPFDAPYDSQTLNTFVDESNPYHELNKTILRDLLHKEKEQ